MVQAQSTFGGEREGVSPMMHYKVALLLTMTLHDLPAHVLMSQHAKIATTITATVSKSNPDFK